MKHRDRSRGVFVPWLVVMIALAGGPAALAQTTVHVGSLEPGDAKLGKYFDTYPLQLAAGERLVATLSSQDFDSYLLLEAPDGTELENDDYGESSDARLDVIAGEPGQWRIKVTSYADGEQGAYRLVINRERLRLVESHRGTLASGDSVSLKGEYYDTYTLRVEANQRILVSMESESFDPFLVLKDPQGNLQVNDDYLGMRESRIDTLAASGGVYQIFATSAQTASGGDYTIRMLTGGRASLRELSGFLDAGDGELEDYGYFEEHALFLRSGEHIIVEMTSQEIDTLLVVEGPNGFYAFNDDFDDLTTISRLDMFAEQEGEYRILAASYQSGASGSYRLRIYSFGTAGSGN